MQSESVLQPVVDVVPAHFMLVVLQTVTRPLLRRDQGAQPPVPGLPAGLPCVHAAVKRHLFAVQVQELPHDPQ